ncbi:hypothetical protein EK21DRAFT_118453 [Setomelanomma holmii]|uniref:Uncharacterized protein n=1 Tax=Setomelanomma holmii TaxID=210430 RepID=A0A9P4LFZ3_9PLEO|nr:hypothetical protein EK21DRAFT_118453 [Setomelanomma holmii]
MATVDSAPGSTPIGVLGSGSGGGGGDNKACLWLYDLRSAKGYILEWLESSKNEPVALDFIQALAHFLWQLQTQGINLGLHLRLIAVNREDNESYLSPASICFANTPPPTVRTLLGMGTNRGYYDTSLEALVQQAAAGNQVFFGDNCQSIQASLIG